MTFDDICDIVHSVLSRNYSYLTVLYQSLEECLTGWKCRCSFESEGERRLIVDLDLESGICDLESGR